MDIETKKQALLNVIREKDMEEIFNVRETEDGEVLFQVHHEFTNGGCLMTIVINSRAYTPVIFHLADLEEPTEEAEMEMLRLLNDLNNKNVLLRFTLEENSIYANFNYLYPSSNFDAEDLLEWTVAAYETIRDYCYPKIMKQVWTYE